MHSDDAMELRITWEEAQELLRPSPTAEPTVVMVEDHLFEEFEVIFYLIFLLFQICSSCSSDLKALTNADLWCSQISFMDVSC